VTELLNIKLTEDDVKFKTKTIKNLI